MKKVLTIIISTIAILYTTTAAAHDGRLDRCEPYRATVERILTEEGVSTRFYYLMVAESGCRSGAVSNKGAEGFWQLTAPTARHYGCKDRHDLESATRAAAKYLKHLGERFERFDDIIRAYNQGGHNFARYGATNESNGLAATVSRLARESQNLPK